MSFCKMAEEVIGSRPSSRAQFYQSLSSKHPQLNDFEKRCNDALIIAQMLIEFAELQDLPQPYQKSLSKLVGILKGEMIS